MERRFCPTSGVRLEQRVGTDPPYITGFAAVFYDAKDPGTEYELWSYDDGADRCVERIMPEAFDNFLVPQVADGIDCCALYNHDPNHLLGRQSAGTLTLSKDAKGLKYSITPPDSPMSKGVIASIQRGDLTGSSFSFAVAPDGQRWIRQGGQCVREIHKLSMLLDVGPVTFPAYSSTTTGTRSAGHVEEARRAYLAWLATTPEGRQRQRETRRLRQRLAERE